MKTKEQTYSSYLNIEKILNAQTPLAEDQHDELLFIITHQVYELWFKQILHEISFLKESFNSKDEHSAFKTILRILKILKTCVSQIDILETMTPLSFASFRDRLDSSSGFQSAQFRMFEFNLGNKNKNLIELHSKNPENYKELKKLYQEPSLFDNFLNFLNTKKEIKIPNNILNRNFSDNYIGDLDVQEVLIAIYKKNNGLNLLCEGLVDLDEGVQEWRYRHIKMVERTIGTAKGTGGSAGVEYLKKSLFKPCFPDLWFIRSKF